MKTYRLATDGFDEWWARGALCILAGRRSSESRMEWPRPWVRSAGRLLCPSYSMSTAP